MAVIYKGKHHCNPSGLHNKVNFLLSEMKWNIDNFDEVINNIVIDSTKTSKQHSSWIFAIQIVSVILLPYSLIDEFGLYYIILVCRAKYNWFNKLYEVKHGQNT